MTATRCRIRLNNASYNNLYACLLCLLVVWPLLFSFHLATDKHSETSMAAAMTTRRDLQSSQSTSSSRNSSSTIVTAYFQIPSKHQKEEYSKWMSIMLSLKDNMVIYCTADWKDAILRFRPIDAQTHFVIMNITELPLAQHYNVTFWQEQLDRDPENKLHASYQVFWIWLSKTWFVANAIHLNPFDSDIYMWSDIGCFRHGGVAKRYRHKLLIQHPEAVPRDRILFLSHQAQPKPPASVWWSNKLRDSRHFYHSGSQGVGYKETWLQFHKAFQLTIQGFLERRLFIGDDQPVMQSTCLQNPTLCAYVTRDQVKDNHWFGLRYVVFHGGNYRYWYPPESY